MILRPILLAAVVAAAASVPMTEASAKNGKNGAFAAGAAAGVVGGVLLGGALSNANAAPAPAPVYVAPAQQQYEVQPAYAEQPRYFDRRWAEIEDLRGACYDGNRRACIRFGMALERNRANRQKWARARPDFYSWERE